MNETSLTPFAKGNRAPQETPWGSLDAAASVALYALSAMLLTAFAAAASAGGTLTGEEASVSFVDVVAVGQRFQFTHFSTNFGSHLFYLATSWLNPGVDLFYGRYSKALAMALVIPLLYLTMRRRLRCGRTGAIIGAACGGLMPGFVSVSWVATEFGLEALPGLVGLLVATTSRRWWWIAPVFAGIAVSLYGSGLPWAVGIVLVLIVRVVSTRPFDRSQAIRVLVAFLASAAILLFPLVWWGGGTILLGGGRVDFGGAIQNLTSLISELSMHGASYYYFTDQPALGSLLMALVALICLVWTAFYCPAIRPWLVVLVASVAMFGIAGGVPGVRRVVAIPLIAALAMGVVSDRLIRFAKRYARTAHLLAVLIAGSALLLPLGFLAIDNRAALVDGERNLPIDFAFPVREGETMVQTLQGIGDGLRNGTTTWSDVAQTWEGPRTAAMIMMLSEHGAIPQVPVDGATVELLYRQSRMCDKDCSPVAGRP